MTILTAAISLCGAACAVQSQTEGVGQESSDLVISRGWSWDLVGIGLNGRSLDDFDLANLGLLGISLDGIKVGRRSVSATLDGSALVGTSADAHKLGLRDFVGAKLTGSLDDGSPLRLVIDDVTRDAGRAHSDVYLYAVSYETDGGRHPLCGVDSTGAPVPAIALAGRWDYRTGVTGGGSHIDDPDAFTFACRGYALAKCVDLGYEPWDSIRACADGRAHCPIVSLADMHQACTRAFRADYCGDGTSYTVDGMTIDVFDAYGYRIPAAGWPFEAEWTTSGARCASRLRVPSLGTPSCWASLQNASCGASSDFGAGALLMTQESP
jgi:hypothetical protein